MATAAQTVFSMGRPVRPRIVFSDLDGTLVHFERHFSEFGSVENVNQSAQTADYVCKETGGRHPCRLLPTSTMGAGLMSERTAALIQQIRAGGTEFAYISGARKATMLTRLPILGEADLAIAEVSAHARAPTAQLPARTQCIPVCQPALPGRPSDRRAHLRPRRAGRRVDAAHRAVHRPHRAGRRDRPGDSGGAAAGRALGLAPRAVRGWFRGGHQVLHLLLSRRPAQVPRKKVRAGTNRRLTGHIQRLRSCRLAGPI
jgi:hypothetical protein